MILTKKTKKLAGMLAFLLVLCCVGTVSYAETISFNITVTKNGYNQDPKSKRATKAGGTNYENKFYATPHTMTPGGVINFRSVNLDDSSICSSWIRSSKTYVSVSSYYQKSAPEKEYYYLQGSYLDSNNNYSLNVTGNYTP